MEKPENNTSMVMPGSNGVDPKVKGRANPKSDQIRDRIAKTSNNAEASSLEADQEKGLSKKARKKAKKLERLSSKIAGIKSELVKKEADLRVFDEKTNQVEIELIRLIKEGAKKKSKRELKDQLKKFANSAKKQMKKKDKIEERLAKKMKKVKKLGGTTTK